MVGAVHLRSDVSGRPPPRRWTIKDSHGQSIIQWSFDNGTRAGTWTWWHSNGQKRLEATYVNGALNGDVLEWDRDGKTAESEFLHRRQVRHQDGRMVHARAEALRGDLPPRVEHARGDLRLVEQQDRHVGGRPAGPDLQHGVWTEWYPSGNKKTEGQYDRGVAVGKITWWYENGQEQAEGEFEAGQKTGTWITWHPNGLKESLVEYKAGKRVTKMLEWSADGKLVESHEGQEPKTPYVGCRTSAVH